MDASELPRIHRDLSSVGWSVSRGSADEAARIVQLDQKWRKIQNSAGASRQSTVLRPMTQAEAPPRSLSAVYGLSVQPLHTDGAHLMEPPDVILLACAATSATDTVIVAPDAWRMPEAVRTGVFTVQGPKGKFLASAYERAFRFDPVVMRPSDQHARSTIDYFAAARITAHQHSWAEPDTLLFINNKRCLHARNAIHEDDAAPRRVIRYAFRTEVAS